MAAETTATGKPVLDLHVFLDRVDFSKQRKSTLQEVVKPYANAPAGLFGMLIAATRAHPEFLQDASHPSPACLPDAAEPPTTDTEALRKMTELHLAIHAMITFVASADGLAEEERQLILQGSRPMGMGLVAEEDYLELMDKVEKAEWDQLQHIWEILAAHEHNQKSHDLLPIYFGVCACCADGILSDPEKDAIRKVAKRMEVDAEVVLEALEAEMKAKELLMSVLTGEGKKP